MRPSGHAEKLERKFARGSQAVNNTMANADTETLKRQSDRLQLERDATANTGVSLLRP